MGLVSGGVLAKYQMKREFGKFLGFISEGTFASENVQKLAAC